ncbi:hypothetical protein [Thalassobellus suaedae]|uniref:Lipocalin-like domain-containing protein n=1 Tax=Thalassobellus suaedae TaxID=3074124 RepID=A0ABY9Y434_9FLAO|nr:hypothetical protein RHP51_10050 [Flavobacteriaceae bacterium HL-DH14]WNH12855.1 hypothetical protein RHP49_01045 [Flavobacteriaceae bacterium HL-DH10]
MKNYILIAFFTLITFTNCSIDGNETSEVITKTYWHLRNVSGGIAGVDNNFNLDEIIWSFNELTGNLTVTNNNTDDTVEDALESGNYSFSVTTDNTNKYLIINDNEYGGLLFSETELIIDQNITSSGSGADGFIYTFQRVLVIED